MEASPVNMQVRPCGHPDCDNQAVPVGAMLCGTCRRPPDPPPPPPLPAVVDPEPVPDRGPSCPDCEAPVDPADRHCPYCGSPLTPPSAPVVLVVGGIRLRPGPEPVLLGREPASPIADLVASNHHVSARHAHLLEVDGRLCIEDLGSANGTFVNDGRLAPRTPHPLAADDQVRLCTRNPVVASVEVDPGP